MSLLTLPNEILLQITEYLGPHPPLINSLLQVNQHLTSLLTPVLLDSACVPGNHTYATEALYAAAERNDKPAIERLLQKGIKRILGEAILCDAVVTHSVGAIATLLDCGFDPEARTRHGCETALWRAAERGTAAVVELLLRRGGVDVNTHDIYGVCALPSAVRKLNAATVKLFLEHDEINVNSQDKQGRTPLFVASERCKTGGEIARMLLDDKRVDINIRDMLGNAPIHFAAKEGNVELMRLLLDNERLQDFNMRGHNGHTALHSAAEAGQEPVVKFLLAHKMTDVNARSDQGTTALHEATQAGRAGVVQLLLGAEGIDLTSSAESDLTLFLIAVLYSRIQVVHVFLRDPRFDVQEADQHGQTPLHMAAQAGDAKMTEILLSYPKTNVNITDKSGKTPLRLAARVPRTTAAAATIKLLLAHPDIDPNLREDNGQTPLHIIAQRGCSELAKLLLSDPRVDPSVRDNEGNTPLHIAAASFPYGQALHPDGVISLLLHHRDQSSSPAFPKIDANPLNNLGETPLIYAAAKSGFGVQALLQCPAVDVNFATPRDGLTALHVAAFWGVRDVVEVLLRDPRIDLNRKDYIRCETPFQWAVAHARSNVVNTFVFSDRRGELDRT